jgi:hypothetical protein
MKRTSAFTLASALVAMLACSGSVLAAKGQPGPPDNGGGGMEPPDYGDLIMLYRDAWGVPIATPAAFCDSFDSEGNPITVECGQCQQPLAVNTADTTACPADCVLTTNPPTVLVDQITCAVGVSPTAEVDGVPVSCAGCTQEVEFGRMSVSRSSDLVFQSQLEDVVFNLATADCVSLDPAGRLVTSRVADDGTVLSAAIDSPLQNLAIYGQLMTTGYLGADPGISLPDDYLATAARGLGAASDKGGWVNVDLVVYLNQIMGLSDLETPTVLNKICKDFREEVMGSVLLVEKCFLNYGPDYVDPEVIGVNYVYDRSDNFSFLPAPAYIPAETPIDGWFEYMSVVETGLEPLETLFRIDQGPILNAAFCIDSDTGEPLDPVYYTACGGTLDDGYAGSNIGAFAQAADDTRAVINFMHNWAVPNADVYATKLTWCEASPAILYDLLIPEQSGLQVPVNYVNTKEREFTVAATNGGPAVANFTVTVIAGSTQEGSDLGTWSWSYYGVPVGATRSVTQPFTITTTSATIYWKATVEALAPGTDPDTSNNVRYATSTVKAAGGGGRP